MRSHSFYFIPFMLAAFMLSGCTQDPAQETMKNQPADDYSYLSRAIDSNVTTKSPPPDAQQQQQQQQVVKNEQVPSAIDDQPTEIPSVVNPSVDEKSQEDDLPFTKKYSGVVIKTNEGSITIDFFNDDAPKTVNNFLKLADEKFYDGIRFHRVIEGFIIQAGDPNSKDDNWADDGQGGPGYTFNDEANSRKLIEGSVAMANAGPNTNGSQFFILTAKSAPLLDGKYTNFGTVTDGMDVVRKIEKVDTDENDHPKENITIESVKLIRKK